jgi:hypothetical protein
MSPRRRKAHRKTAELLDEQTLSEAQANDPDATASDVESVQSLRHELEQKVHDVKQTSSKLRVSCQANF